METSKLRDALTGDDVLDKMTGWSPLILCLMYESQRDDSFWKPYFGKYNMDRNWQKIEHMPCIRRFTQGVLYAHVLVIG